MYQLMNCGEGRLLLCVELYPMVAHTSQINDVEYWLCYNNCLALAGVVPKCVSGRTLIFSCFVLYSSLYRALTGKHT